MSKIITLSTNGLAFVDARLTQIRLVSERATSTPPVQSKDANHLPLQVQLRTETASGFSVGLDLPENPSVIVIRIDYKASLIIPDTGKHIVDYEATHEAQFSIAGWTGFDDWTNMPPTAISSYFTTMNNIALRKAEVILLEMGFKGVTLPQPEKFDGVLTPTPVAAVSEKR